MGGNALDSARLACGRRERGRGDVVQRRQQAHHGLAAHSRSALKHSGGSGAQACQLARTRATRSMRAFLCAGTRAHAQARLNYRGRMLLVDASLCSCGERYIHSVLLSRWPACLPVVQRQYAGWPGCSPGS